MHRVLAASTASVLRRMRRPTTTGLACQKRPLPSSVQASDALLGARFGGGISWRFSSTAASAALHGTGEPRNEAGQEAGVGVAARAAGAAKEDEDGIGNSSNTDGPEVSTGGAGAAATASRHTVVRHPPAPGWEYPPVPQGCEPKFAVIRLGNTQHKVTKDDVIVAEKVAGDIGTTLEVTDVLLVATKEGTAVGRPLVPGASVKLFIEEQTRDKKVVVLKKRRRKASKTTQGHRREVTLLRVIDVLS